MGEDRLVDGDNCIFRCNGEKITSVEQFKSMTRRPSTFRLQLKGKVYCVRTAESEVEKMRRLSQEEYGGASGGEESDEVIEARGKEEARLHQMENYVRQLSMLDLTHPVRTHDTISLS